MSMKKKWKTLTEQVCSNPSRKRLKMVSFRLSLWMLFMTRLLCKLSFQRRGKGDSVRAGGWGQQNLDVMSPA